MKTIAIREVLYFFGCVLFGLVVLPALVILAGNFAIDRHLISPPEMFASVKDIPGIYRHMFSGPIEFDRDFFLVVIGFYCLLPYAIFWVVRLTCRTLRPTRKHQNI